jgi:hypothetical protein
VTLSDQKAREELYRRASEKWQQLKKSETETWGDYAAIGEALFEKQREIMHVLGVNSPHGRGFQKTMKTWLVAHKLNDMDKSVRSRLIELTKYRSEVQEMMAEWSLNQRMEWNHPNTVYRRWITWRKGEGIQGSKQKKTVSAAKQTRQELAAAQNELLTMKEQLTKKSQDFDALQASFDEKGGIVITIKEHARTQAEKLLAKAPPHWINDFANELLAGIERYAAKRKKKDSTR